MRILFVGDVVGRAGRTAVAEHLPGMVRDWALDLVIVNGENAAGGFGITEPIYQELLDAGADAITLGNHAWDQREALVFIERAPRLIRPANFPKGTPGRGSALVETKRGQRALVINAMGRVFMTPFDDPFATIARELEACPLREAADAIVVDFHCEATSEKQGIGYFCDGRVSLVVGTHTHVPTADHQILAGGTAYMTDAGMTGDYDFDHRHAEGRAAAPLHLGHSLRPFRARRRRGDAERRGGGDRRCDRSRPQDRPGADRRKAGARAAGILEGLEPEELLAQRVLVFFLGVEDGTALLVLLEMRLFPFVEFCDDVIDGSELLFLPDRSDPGFHCVLVVGLQFVELRMFAHRVPSRLADPRSRILSERR